MTTDSLVSNRPILHTPKSNPGISVAPRALPFLGHLLEMFRNREALLLENAERFKSPFWLNEGFGNWVVIVPSEAFFRLLKHKSAVSIASERLPDVFNHNVLGANGADHRRMRGAMNKPFSPPGLTSARVGEVINDLSTELLNDWDVGTKIPVLHTTGLFTLNVIFKMLGVPALELPQWREKFGDYMNTGINIFNSTLPGMPRWKSRRAIVWMEERFQTLVDTALATGDKDSIIGALAHGKDEVGGQLSRKELMSNLRGLSFAGHETTAGTIGWMLIHIAHEPELWEKLLKEALANDQPPLAPGELANFPYAEGLFRECLRVYPGVGVGPHRRLTEDVEIDGVTIRANTLVAGSIFGVSKDKAVYPEPNKIRPERWMDLGRTPRGEEIAQFGGGPHFCLGYHMAVLEGTQFIVQVAQRLGRRGLRLEPVGKKLPRPKYMVLTHPPSSAKVRVVPA